MNMLTGDDLQQIGELMDDKLGNMVEQLLFPKFDEIDVRFDKLESRFGGLESRVDALPDKNFVTEKIGELRGEMNLRFRQQETRTDELIGGLSSEMNTGFEQSREQTGNLVQVLKEKGVITSADVARVDAVRLYPRQIG
jgi:hypothetical protein